MSHEVTNNTLWVVGVVLILCGTCCQALQDDTRSKPEFDSWAAQYSKSYASANSYSTALQNWLANDARIRKHNADETSSWSLGHNQFSDLTPQEYGRRLGGKSPPSTTVTVGLPALTGPLPDSIDWVSRGAVTPVKDQGNCGSCWAFSTTGAIEGAFQRATGKLLSLSEQNLVSCSFNGDLGCGGGEQSDALCWTYHNKGLCEEKAYPYSSGGGQDGRQCLANCTPAVTVTGYHSIPKGNETALMEAIQHGPVAIGLDASQSAFG